MRDPKSDMGIVLMIMSPALGYLPCMLFADSYPMPSSLKIAIVWFIGMLVCLLAGYNIYTKER